MQSRSFSSSIYVAFLVLLSAPVANAAHFFVDPINGSPSGDGSSAQPWQSLQQVIEDGLVETQRWDAYPYGPTSTLIPSNAGAPVQAGDTVWLADGYHGEVNIENAYNAETISVVALLGHRPTVSRISVRSSQRWRFDGITVSPAFADGPVAGSDLVRVESHGFRGPASEVTFSNGDLFTVDNADNWSAQDWISEARSGMTASGATQVTFRNNEIRNVRHGITVNHAADYAVVTSNLIDGFSADGMRGLGDYGRFEHNVVRDAYVSASDGDPNHDDGFQSWSVDENGSVGKGEVIGVVLRGNVFINYSDPNRPLRATLQGIGCFDGFFTGWTVENNVVIVDHWHGITFMGMRDSLIANNTLIDPNFDRPGPPWVRVVDHKDGSTSRNVIVANNLTPSLSGVGSVGVTHSGNIEYSDAASHFAAPPYDLHLLSTSTAVNAAAASHAPVVDRDGIRRPQQSSPDVGAYEFCPNCGAILFADGFE